MRVRVATYQLQVSGAGAQAMDRLAHEAPGEHDLRMDWEFDGEEFDEESKLREETRKIMELPRLALQSRLRPRAGHGRPGRGRSFGSRPRDELSPAQARELLAACTSIRLEEFPSPAARPGSTRCSSGASAPT